LVAVPYLVCANFYVHHGALNPDEGFYAVAARAVYQGELPYRDFGYTQMPLLPYVNGLVLHFTGSGLFAQRVLNGLWGALALALAAGWVARRVSGAAAVLLVAVFALSAPWMHFVHLGKTYAFTGLVVVLAAWVWLEGPAGRKKSALLGLLGVIGVGCRLPAAPFFAVLWLASLADGPRPTLALLRDAGLLLLAAVAALLLPFYLAAPEASVFWTLDFHRLSVPEKTWRLSWQAIATLAPTLWAASLAAGGVVLFQRPTGLRRALVLGGAALLTLAANLLPQGVYEEYGVPFLLPLAMSLAAILGRALAAQPTAWRDGCAAAAIALQLLVAPLLLWSEFPERRFTRSQWLTPNTPEFNPALPEQLAHARQVITELVPPGRPLIGPNLILALEADRPVPANLRMGPFSLAGDSLPLPAAQLHLVTPAEIDAYLADPAVPLLALFTRPELNYGWTMPTFAPPADEITSRWLQAYRRDFTVAYQEEYFLLLARQSAR
jgi:hypothetical protein